MPQLTASLRPSNTSLVPSPQQLLRGLLQGLLGASQYCLAAAVTPCKDSQQLPSLVPSRLYIVSVRPKPWRKT